MHNKTYQLTAVRAFALGFLSLASTGQALITSSADLGMMGLIRRRQ